MHARRLFVKNGYQATSVAEIAAAANCAPRTFFQYFSSKEDLLLLEVDAVWQNLQDTLLQRPTSQSALQAMRVWMLEIIQQFEQHETFLPAIEDETSTSYLSAKARQELYSMNKLEEILLPEVSKDLNMEVTDLLPQLTAAAAAALFNAIHNDSLQNTNKEAYVTSVVDFLERGMATEHKP